MGWWSRFKKFCIDAWTVTVTNVAAVAATPYLGVVAAAVIIAVVSVIPVVVLIADLFVDDSCTTPSPAPLQDFSNMAGQQESDYHASIHREKLHFCSGAIIATNLILTVAQCVHTFVDNKKEIRKLEIHPAIRDVSVDPSIRGYAVDSIKVHPDFMANRLAYNIAVLKLTEEIAAPFARPIPLPKPRPNKNKMAEKSTVLVSGFKSSEEPSRRISMTKSNMTVIAHNTCRSHFNNEITVGHKFCVLPSKRWKPCQTGRGGTAVTTDGVLAGLYMFPNFKGCAKDLPEIFVDVSYYIDFISEVN